MRRTIYLFTFIVLVSTAFQATSQQLPRPYGELVWQDEFEGTTIDPNKWDRQEYNRRNNDNGPDGWWSKEDSFLDGEGNLVIRVRKIENKNDDNDPHDYSTAGIRTKGKFSQRYGRFEARCKLPKQQGWWVAFWMMQGNVGSTYNGGVDGSEVDIMEGFGWNDKINLAVHWDGYGSAHKSTGTKIDLQNDRNAFHTYTLDWFPEKYVFYIDGEEMWRTEGGGVCNQAGYIKLSGELSTVSSLSNEWWANDPEEATYPDSFFVDYVRVYQFPDAQSPFNAQPASLPGVIEAEQFDQGRAGDAYKDNTEDNSGEIYRVGDVDIASCSEGNYCVTGTEAGEWLAYTVDAKGFGTYDIKITYTSTSEGAIAFQYDDKALGSEITLPPTGKNITGFITVENLKLKGGVHELKVLINKGGFQLDKLEFIRKGVFFSLDGLSEEGPFEIGDALGFNVEAASTGLGISSIGLYWNGDSVAGSNDSIMLYEIVTTEANHGWNEFVITVYDNGGNSISDTLLFHVGNMYPEVQIVSPADSAILYRDGEMQLMAEATDHDGDVKYVVLYVNGAQRSYSVYPPYKFDISYLGAGEYDISVKVLDNRDDAAYDTVHIIVADRLFVKGDWKLVNSGGAISTLALISDTATVCVDRSTERLEDIALSTTTSLSAGEKYRISFVVKSELTEGAVLRLWNNPDKEQLLDTVPLPNDIDTIRFEITPDAELEQALLDFQLGGAGTGCVGIYDLTAEIITSLHEEKTRPQRIYPNPANNVLHFLHPADYTIYNITGSSIRTGNKASSADVSSLPEGIYFVKTDNTISKFIKQ